MPASMDNYAISLYTPNQAATKESFGVVIKSSAFDDVDSFYNPNAKTFITEKTDKLIERLTSESRMFRKKINISLVNKDDEAFAVFNLTHYNIPYMLSKDYNMTLFLHDNPNPSLSWEDEFILSIMDENSMPDSFIVPHNRPILVLKDLVVASKERGKGYGGYLFRSYSDYIQGVLGLDFGAVFACNAVLMTADDTENDKVSSQFFDTKQSIIMKWFNDYGYKQYGDNSVTGRKFFVKKIGKTASSN